MPPTITIAAFVFGAVLLLIALVGGKIKIFGAEISGTAGGIGRLIAFILGIIFIGLSLSSGFNSPAVPSPTQVYSTSTPNNISPTSVPKNTSVPPNTTPPQAPAALPANSGCPAVQGATWLTSPSIQYGPYDSGGISYVISYDQNYIYVGNLNDNTTLQFEDPATYGGRNQWIPLQNTPYSICVDTQGNVYAVTQ